MKVALKIVFVFVVTLLLQPLTAESQTINYTIEAELSDGSELSGVFGIDLSAADTRASGSLGMFGLVNVDVALVNSSLLLSPSTSGLATDGFLFQSNGEQEIGFNFISDDGISGAFTDGLAFGPFSGDVNGAAAIEGDYVGGGFLDGNGGADFVSVSVQEIPEPGNSTLAMVALMIGGLLRRPSRLLERPL